MSMILRIITAGLLLGTFPVLDLEGRDAGHRGTEGVPTVFATTAEAAPLLISFPLEAPAAVATIGQVLTPHGSAVAGCDFRHGGDFTELLCIDRDGGVFTLDTQTAGVTLLHQASAPDPFQAFTVDPTTGDAFATTVDLGDETTELYRIDATSGIETLVGAVGLPSVSFTSIGVANNGVLYGSNSFTFPADGELYRIDKTSAIATLVGTWSFLATFESALDFDERDGRCYFFADNADSGQSELHRCEGLTGQTTLIDAMPSALRSAAIAAGGDLVFADGFELGDTSPWSAAVP